MGLIADFLTPNLTPKKTIDNSAEGAMTYLASNETPRSLAMNNPALGAAPTDPVTAPLRAKLASAAPSAVDDAEDDADPSPAAPLAPSGNAAPAELGSDLSKYRVTPEDLKAASDKKRAALVMGAIGDSLGNQQSFGNFFLGRMNPKNDVMGDAQKFADLSDSDIKNKQTMLAQGMKENENRLKMAKGAADLMKAQREQGLQKEMDDPSSQISKLNAATAIRVGAKFGIELNPAELSKMSFTQQQEAINKNPLWKEAMQSDVAGKRLSAMLANQASNRDIKEQNLELKKEAAGAQAGRTVEAAALPFKKVLNSIVRADTILTGNEPVTAKSLAIAQQDFINAVAAGGAATEGKVNREMIHTMQDAVNDLQLKFGDVKDLRETQPQVIKHMRGLFKQVREDYEKAMEESTHDAAGSYSTSTNQHVKDVLKQKSDRYKSHEEAAKPPPNGNKVVVQGGHTFTWNGITGKYE